ncbi:hypothetical protein [Vibrio cholerae]|uniref:hypothetical protein n=1 Tax=Vibrio cholerae TaxID=666 RepID=UPI001E299F9A|nr:hypothetical protein [Vibrio cholerae]MCD6678941.1 hypothetical protein [Vibrio cholerae]
MAEIFALQGIGSSGKTSTLREVFNQLRTKYPTAPIDIINNGADITVVIDINGIKVGIESQGDPNSRLQTSLPYFVSLKCDVIFCAIRTKGMTVQWVNQCSNKYKVQFVPKLQSSNGHAQINLQQALNLISMAGL